MLLCVRRSIFKGLKKGLRYLNPEFNFHFPHLAISEIRNLSVANHSSQSSEKGNANKDVRGLGTEDGRVKIIEGDKRAVN